MKKKAPYKSSKTGEVVYWLECDFCSSPWEEKVMVGYKVRSRADKRLKEKDMCDECFNKLRRLNE